MTLEEIKRALAFCKTVHWANDCYEVIKDSIGQYLIRCTFNNYCIGLTHMDGVTMNGNEHEFYLLED